MTTISPFLRSEIGISCEPSDHFDNLWCCNWPQTLPYDLKCKLESQPCSERDQRGSRKYETLLPCGVGWGLHFLLKKLGYPKPRIFGQAVSDMLYRQFFHLVNLPIRIGNFA